MDRQDDRLRDEDVAGAIFRDSKKRPRARAGPDAARAHAERVNGIQKYFVERTRLGIPIIPFEEALHGFYGNGATAFPQAIALAATWDTALMSRVATAIARASRRLS